MTSDLLGAAGIALIAVANLWKWGQEGAARGDLIVGLFFVLLATALLVLAVRPR